MKWREERTALPLPILKGAVFDSRGVHHPYVAHGPIWLHQPTSSFPQQLQSQEYPASTHGAKLLLAEEVALAQEAQQLHDLLRRALFPRRRSSSHLHARGSRTGVLCERSISKGAVLMVYAYACLQKASCSLELRVKQASTNAHVFRRTCLVRELYYPASNAGDFAAYAFSILKIETVSDMASPVRYPCVCV